MQAMKFFQIPVYFLSSTTPNSSEIQQSFEAIDGAIVMARYRWTRCNTDGHWIANLYAVEEIMPPRTPQISTYSEADRVPMMDEYGFSFTAEAEQRRKEWAEITAQSLCNSAHATKSV